MTFKNAKRFKGKLAQLPKVIEEAARAAMEELADQIVELMRSLVPVRTGKLRDSIGWVWGDPPAGFTGLVTVIGGGKATGINRNKITIFAGGDEAFWARWVEFGTFAHAAGAYRDHGGRKRNAGAHGHAATPAQPFFYPAWRAFKSRIPRGISAKVNPAIKRLAASQHGD